MRANLFSIYTAFLFASQFSSAPSLVSKFFMNAVLLVSTCIRWLSLSDDDKWLITQHPYKLWLWKLENKVNKLFFLSFQFSSSCVLLMWWQVGWIVSIGWLAGWVMTFVIAIAGNWCLFVCFLCDKRLLTCNSFLDVRLRKWRFFFIGNVARLGNVGSNTRYLHWLPWHSSLNYHWSTCS